MKLWKTIQELTMIQLIIKLSIRIDVVNSMLIVQ